MMHRELDDVSEALNGLDYRQVRPLRPGVYGILVLTVKDKDGRVVERRVQRTRSPTQWFFVWLLIGTLKSCVSTPMQTTTPPTSTSTSSNSLCANCGNACWTTEYNQLASTYIIVGSGTQSNPYTAGTLAAPIGTSVVTYGNPSYSSSVATSGSEAYFVVTETITNKSSSTITISEIGIFLEVIWLYTGSNSSYGPYWIMVWYDALSSPVSVGSGQSLTITYTFTANP